MSPGATSHGYPYPLGTDRVADGDEAIRDLAQAIDTKLGVVAGGTVTIPIVAAGTNYNVVVTYPAGRFVDVPSVFVTPQSVTPTAVRASVRDATLATGMTVVGTRDSGTATFPVMWVAVLAP